MCDETSLAGLRVLTSALPVLEFDDDALGYRFPDVRRRMRERVTAEDLREYLEEAQAELARQLKALKKRR